MPLTQSEYVSYVKLEDGIRIQVPIIAPQYRRRGALPDPGLLLHPNIPAPMSNTAPRTVLGADWWDLARKRAYIHGNLHCWACNVHKSKARDHHWLEGHEYYDVNFEKGRLVFRGLVALCHYCHSFIHDGHMAVRMKAGDKRYTQKKCDKVIRHGLRLLNKHDCLGMKPTRAKMADVQEYRLDHARSSGTVAAWEDWRLVVNGVQFPGFFKSYQDCQDYYRGSD